MNGTMKKMISFLILVVFITGCSSMSDRSNTIAQGCLVGTGIGAALGAVVGELAGDNAAAGAAIGGTFGAVVGCGYGNHVANKKEAYANEEEWLNDCIASTCRINEETIQYNESLKYEIAQLDKEINELVALYNTKQIDKATLEEQRRIVQAKLDEANKKLGRAKDEIRMQQTALASAKNSSPQKVAKLENEINKLENSVASLEKEAEKLIAIKQGIGI
jgi:uncharacterized protein YcfJ